MTDADKSGTTMAVGSDFHVVGIGASAGGLEPLEKLFSHLPSDTGMAFVVVQHLSPDFKSLMSELLSRRTTMPVRPAEHEMAVELNCVYLIPPTKEMTIKQRRLLLHDKDPKHGLALPIDHFLRSLAHDIGERSVAVILSGSGSDGTGKGSVFTVSLPLAAPQPGGSREPANGVRTVVIVEDQPDARRMLQILLESMGVRVFTAENGKEGAALIERVQPDLALVDLGLPVMNGYEVAAWFAASSKAIRSSWWR